MTPVSRRQMLGASGTGLGLLGLADALRADAPPPAASPLAPKPTHFAPKAKRVIHLFMNGGPSHVDTFDPKPDARQAATARRRFANNLKHRAGKTGAACTSSPYKPSAKYGQVGRRGQRNLRRDRQAHRRHLRHPLDARRRSESRAVAAAHDDVRRGMQPAPAQPRLVGSPTASAASTRTCPASSCMCPGGYPIQVDAELWNSRASCRGSTRAPHIDTSLDTDIEKLDRERPQQVSSAASRTQRRAARLAATPSTERHAGPARARRRSSRRASSRSSWPTACKCRRHRRLRRVEGAEANVRERVRPRTYSRRRQILASPAGWLEKGVRFVQVWLRRAASRGTTTTDLEVKATAGSRASDDRQAIGRAADGPQASCGMLDDDARASGAASSAGRRRSSCRRPARTRARSTAATTTTGASRCGWPAAASRAARHTARPTSSASRAVRGQGPRA